MCATSCCDLHLTFAHAVMPLTFKILSRLHLGNHKVKKLMLSQGHWLAGVGGMCRGVTLI